MGCDWALFGELFLKLFYGVLRGVEVYVGAWVWVKLLKINIYLNPLSKYFPLFQTSTFHKSLIFFLQFSS